MIRNQFVSVSRGEVCTVTWPKLWSEFSISFCFSILCIMVIFLRSKWKKKKREKEEKTHHGVIHTISRGDGESKRKTYWAEYHVYVCSWTIHCLSLSRLWVQTYDQNVVICPKCEESVVFMGKVTVSRNEPRSAQSEADRVRTWLLGFYVENTYS